MSKDMIDVGGQQLATSICVQTAAAGDEVEFYATGAVFNCTNYLCHVRVRLDGAPAIDLYPVQRQWDGSRMLLTNAGDLARKISHARTMLFQAAYVGAPPQVAEFNVSNLDLGQIGIVAASSPAEPVSAAPAQLATTTDDSSTPDASNSASDAPSP